MALQANRAGLALGSLVGGVHVVWMALVAAGVAQAWMDWIFGLHAISPAFVVTDFSLVGAVELVVITAIVGYVVGWAFASIWNNVSAK